MIDRHLAGRNFVVLRNRLSILDTVRYVRALVAGVPAVAAYLSAAMGQQVAYRLFMFFVAPDASDGRAAGKIGPCRKPQYDRQSSMSVAQGEQVMRKLYSIALMGLALGMSQQAFAEVVNLTNSADGATHEAAVTAVKKNLNDACTDRKGQPVADSFKIDGEVKSANPEVPKPFHIDARMKCDLPEG
ncbi:hypothetical protein [Lysobacter sp. CA199]|uniref:hypothetical protein n=1 Tax=Lysobacter sp. CA199 TaxID=3455608 RepID=UPI003F8CF890